MRRGSIADYEDLVIPDGYGVIYEYYIPSLDKSYIGQTTDLMRRHQDHRSRGRLSPYIREDDYILNVLEFADRRRLDHLEQVYIQRLDTQAPNGLNVHQGGRIEGMVPKDFSDRMEWTFREHRDLWMTKDGFWATVWKDQGQYCIMIPREVADDLHIREGSRVMAAIDRVDTEHRWAMDISIARNGDTMRLLETIEDGHKAAIYWEDVTLDDVRAIHAYQSSGGQGMLVVTDRIRYVERGERWPSTPTRRGWGPWRTCSAGRARCRSQRPRRRCPPSWPPKPPGRPS